jgi:hypothetical protein
MAALTQSRNTKRRDGRLTSDPVAAATKIFAGSMIALDATGYAVPAGTAGAGPARAIAKQEIDNTDGADGALRVEGERTVGAFGNSAAADLIARADIGATAYVVDDQTVAKTDGGATREAAGVIVDVDADGVWVAIGG